MNVKFSNAIALYIYILENNKESYINTHIFITNRDNKVNSIGHNSIRIYKCPFKKKEEEEEEEGVSM